MVELFLTKKTNVYNYSVTSSGATNIGSLIRSDDERGYRLDLFEGEKIPITYQISDVNDPSKKKSPYSKNFLIPGTKRNSIALDFPYMISSNVAFSVYNGSVVETGVTGQFEWHLPIQESQLYIDGILAFTGQLELSRAIINNGEVNSFEVNFLSTQINIFDELENKNMRDLDLPTPELASASDVYKAFGPTKAGPFAETFTIAGVTYEGFRLAYPDWGFTPVGPTGYVTDGVPAWATTGRTKIFTTSNTPPTDINNAGLWVGYNFTFYAFAITLIDKIFEGIDFSYSSDFFQSDEFCKLLLLCYDSSQPPSNTQLKIFGSNPSATSYYNDAFATGQVNCPTPKINQLTSFNRTGTVPGASPFNANEKLRDPFEIWTGESLQFQSPGVYTIRLKAVVDIRFGWDMLYGGQGANCPGGTPNANVYPWATASLLGPNSEIYFYNERTGVKITRNIAGLTMTNTALSSPATYVKGGVTHYQWESSHDAYTTPLDYTLLAEAGDIWKLYIKTDSDNYCNQAVAFGCNALPISQRKYQPAVDVLALDISPYYHNWNQTLPDITQKDFLVAIIKHFNLYTEIAPNSRIVTFEPRDDFYNFGNVQDWTNKVDLNTAREIVKSSPPSYVIARMAQTDNRDDKTRQETTEDNLEYGSYKEFLTNGKGDGQEFTSMFGSLIPDNMKSITVSGTLDVRNINNTISYNIPNPALFVQDEEGNRTLTEKSIMYLGYTPTRVTPRTASGTNLFANYFLPGPTGYISNLSVNPGTSTSGTADHLWSLSSIGSTGNDINFNPTQTTWLSDSGVPLVFNFIQTNYDVYFKSFYDNLNEQKILKAQVRLQPSDIARFSFRNPIWITFPNGDGDYFIVSSIQYDPTSTQNSTVELLTFNKEYFNFSYEDVGPAGPPGPVPSPPTPSALPPDQSTGGEYPIKGES
jgi:hypothetical protein